MYSFEPKLSRLASGSVSEAPRADARPVSADVNKQSTSPLVATEQSSTHPPEVTMSPDERRKFSNKVVNAVMRDNGIVMEIQKALTERGFATRQDSMWGEETKSQIEAFERKVGLRPTGLPGPKVLAALFGQELGLSIAAGAAFTSDHSATTSSQSSNHAADALGQATRPIKK